MYSTSSEFLDKIKDTIRRIFGKVIIDFTDPFIDQSITPSVNEQVTTSYPEQVTDSLSSPTYKYASLDGSSVLDNTFHLAPSNLDDGQMGWWGSTLSGIGGVFNTPYPKLTVEFFSRPVHSLKVVGDDKRGEWPVDFVIKLYGVSDTLLYTKTVTGNTEINWTENITPVVSVIKMTLEISKWSHAGRQVKILEFFTSIQETYEGDDIIALSVLEERDVSQGSLPIGNMSANEVEIKINNIDNKFDAGNSQSPLYELLKANRRIRPFLGAELDDKSKEYVPLGVFWSGDWEVPEKEIYAKTTARDRLELLRKSTYSSSQVLTNVSLYNLAVDVLEDAGLTSEEYWVDTELQDYIIPYAWFNPQSHREALRIIAEACLGQCYCDRQGIVRIEGSAFLESKITSDLTITYDEIWSKDNPVRWSEIANYVEVETAPLQPVAVVEEIYKSNSAFAIPAGGQKTITAYYNSSPCIDTVASLEGAINTTISSVTYYAWGLNMTLSNDGGSTENITVVVTGKPLQVLNKEKAISQDTNSILDNGKLKYTFPENSLIQTLEIAQTIADKILNVYKNPRRDIELNWRGNPAAELGDRITAPDYKNISTQDYYVIRQTLEYDGGLTSTKTGRRAS